MPPLDEFGLYVPNLVHPDMPPPSDLSGDGSPEGVQAANPGQTYWDATANQLYVKDTGVNTTTGWRTYP